MSLLIVLVAGIFVYIALKLRVTLAGSTVKIRGLEIPIFVVLSLVCFIGISVLTLFEAFEIKPAAMVGAVVIEALAFESLCSRRVKNDSASIWLLKAFAIGGLFLFCIALLA